MRNSWIGFVGGRWLAARRRGGGSLSSLLAATGIAVGVAALIVVLGVMNGFQLGYIESILEVSSFHALLEGPPSPDFDAELASRLAALPGTRGVLPFLETEALAGSEGGRSRPVRLRVLPADALSRDPAFFAALGLGPSRAAAAAAEGGLILGSELARALGVATGDEVTLAGVRASVEEGVEPVSARLVVSEVFRSGYYEFDAGLAIAGRAAARGFFPPDRPSAWRYGIKLEDRFGDRGFAAAAAPLLRAKGLEPAALEGWRSYNRSFFGALRTEKTAMMLLVGLIFLVVGVNIYHAMRRAVAERAEDIAVLRALGAEAAALQRAFVLDGLAIGAGGALAGLAVGLLVAVNVNEVFALVEAAVNGLAALAATLTNWLSGLSGGDAPRDFRVFSPRYFYLMEVPVRVLFPETFFVVAAAAGSAAAAAGAAASRVAGLSPAEALRYE